MLKYTRTTLTKLETILKQADYVIRYERGNFKSGYCIVESKNVAVINKFFDVEARINILIEILGTIDIVTEKLDESSIEMLKSISDKLPIATAEVTPETTPVTQE